MDHYSKKNPHGPFAPYRYRPHETKKPEHIEGFSTKKNLDEWSRYASDSRTKPAEKNENK